MPPACLARSFCSRHQSQQNNNGDGFGGWELQVRRSMVQCTHRVGKSNPHSQGLASLVRTDAVGEQDVGVGGVGQVRLVTHDQVAIARQHAVALRMVAQVRSGHAYQSHYGRSNTVRHTSYRRSLRERSDSNIAEHVCALLPAQAQDALYALTSMNSAPSSMACTQASRVSSGSSPAASSRMLHRHLRHRQTRSEGRRPAPGGQAARV